MAEYPDHGPDTKSPLEYRNPCHLQSGFRLVLVISRCFKHSWPETKEARVADEISCVNSSLQLGCVWEWGIPYTPIKEQWTKWKTLNNFFFDNTWKYLHSLSRQIWSFHDYSTTIPPLKAAEKLPWIRKSLSKRTAPSPKEIWGSSWGAGLDPSFFPSFFQCSSRTKPHALAVEHWRKT